MVASGSHSFVAYDALGDTPNIVVDGSGNAATEITLSHWPKSGTPRPLKADSSAEIVFNYLDSPAFHVAAQAVSNNHFDQDGLVGVFTLIAPEAALAMRDLLIDVAHAGDFATYRDRRAARIAFTVAAFDEPEISPLDKGIFAMPYEERCAALYIEMLPRLGEIAADTEGFAHYWEHEDRVLEESEQAIHDGQVTIEEVPHVDLAVVRVPETHVLRAAHRFTQPCEVPCHPMAVHNATRCNRVLTVQGRRYGFLYRYESWVQYVTAPPPPRCDLTPLAEELTVEEPGSAAWSFEDVSELTPTMTLEGGEESAIAPEAFLTRLVAFLAAAPPAWDPYDPE